MSDPLRSVRPATRASGARAVARCDELAVAPYSDEPDMLFRAYLTPAHAASLERLTAWMTEAGMTVRLDAAANLIGRYEGTDPHTAPLIIGSHIDSVRDGGSYDGALGVTLGIECVAALHEQGRRLSFPIEVVAFGDEEGSRFHVAMLCSRAFAGVLQEAALDVSDSAGLTVLQALVQFPGLGAGDSVLTAAHGPALAFIEAHIEQGPELESDGLAVGVVSGIAAQLRFQVSFEGKAGHAGTNAMHLRRDALAGAAEAMSAIERIARETGGDVVATVGRLSVDPGAVNVVPGRVDFSIDVRSGDEVERNAAADRIIAAMKAITGTRGLKLSVKQVQDLPATPCDPALMAMLEAAMVEAGHPPRSLVSGAGHDAMVMSSLCPTAMLFIRCEGGVSHNRAEAVTHEDAHAALATMLNFIDQLDASLSDPMDRAAQIASPAGQES